MTCAQQDEHVLMTYFIAYDKLYIYIYIYIYKLGTNTHTHDLRNDSPFPQ